METKDSKQHSISYSGLACCIKCFPISSSPSSSPPQLSPVDELPEKQGLVLSSSKPTKRKPGGWRAMPYVLGNETFERLASMGLLANFMIFLLTQFHLEQASAANVLNIWSAVGNFAPLVGAFISDALIGRFLTIGFSSFASLLGMVTLTLIAGFPQLHPPPCTSLQLLHHQCQGPTSSQMGLLILALGLLSIGTGGIRPCNIPFGVDQFDPTTDEGRKGINSFFNWYYTTFTVVLIIAITVVVYIQSNVSWVWGFGIPTFFMVGSIVLFFFGMKVYVYVKPEGSVFTGIVQAVVAAYKKRGLKIPTESEKNVVALYDPPPAATVIIKLPLTSQFRFLNKGAIVLEGEVKQDGSRSNAWRLSSVQQIEEVKCILRIIPVWASGIISFVAIVQQSTFTISQALKMDRHLGPKFQIPPGSLIIISMVTLGLWVPIYDWLVVPALRKITKVETGITLLQRMGIGLVFSILSMVVAGLVERMRRASAISHGREDGVAPMSVLWLAPQLSLMGFSEAFNIIGQIEFYNRQFPENMSSIANSLFCVTMAGASYISSLLVFTLHNVTGGHGRPDWLVSDINAGRIDYFYFIIAAMGVLNMVYFLVVARRYNYKAGVFANNKDEKSQIDVELNAVKL